MFNQLSSYFWNYVERSDTMEVQWVFEILNRPKSRLKQVQFSDSTKNSTGPVVQNPVAFQFYKALKKAISVRISDIEYQTVTTGCRPVPKIRIWDTHCIATDERGF